MQSVTEMLATVKNQLGSILNGRIENAAKLIEAGAVTRVSDFEWTVKSQSSDTTYKVWFKLGWNCECVDHAGTGHHPAAEVEFFGGRQRTCKHIISAAFCWASGEYPSPKQAALYDLAIATRKRPFTTGSEDYLIIWYKRAGEVAVHPKGKKLTDSDIQKALGRYTLVHTEALQSMIVRRYKFDSPTDNLQGVSA